MKLVLTLVLSVLTIAAFSYHLADNNLQKSSQTIVKSTTEEIATPQTTELVKNIKVIKNLNLHSDRTVFLFGAVNDNTTPLANEIDRMNSNDENEPIILLINSPGGSVITGATLVNKLETSKAPIYTVCYQLCASMAAIIHQYGKKRYALDRSILMFHRARTGAQGYVEEINSLMKTLTRYIDKFTIHIALRVKITPEDFRRRMADEYWIDSEDAIKENFVDGLVNLNLEDAKLHTDLADNIKASKKAIEKSLKDDIIW